MRSIEIEKWQGVPEIAAIVKATFPDYRKRKVRLYADDVITLHGLNWSGGSRAEYRACTVQGRFVGSTERYAQMHPMNNVAEGATLPVPPGIAVVEGGTFCGKTATLRITVNPRTLLDNIPSSVALIERSA